MTTSKFSFIHYIHYIIVAVLIFGFRFIPAPMPITSTGMALLGAFLGAIYGWSTIGIIWPSLLAIIGMSITLTAPTVLSTGLGSNITWMIVITYIVMGLMQETKLMDTLSAFLLTRNFSKGRPWICFGFIIFAAFVCGTVGGFASVILFLTLIYNIADKLNYKPFDKFTSLATIGVMIASLMSMIVFPFFGNAVIFIGIWQSMSQMSVDFAKYMMVSIPLSILAILTYLFVCRFILRLDLTPLKEFKIEDLGISTVEITKKQKLALIVLLWMFADLIIPSICPKTWAVVQFLQCITIFGQVAIPVLVFMVIPFDGKPLIDFHELSKNISWDIILITGTILPLATFLTGEDTGISAFMVSLIQPLVNLGLNTFVFLFIIMLIAAIATNFANNTVVSVIVMPIILAIVKINPSLSGMAGFFILVFMSHLAFLTPSACPYAAIAFGNSNRVSIKSIIKYGLPVFLCLFLVIFCVGYLMASILL